MSHSNGWSLTFQVDADNRRVIEALTTMSDGTFGRRGLPLGPDHVERSMVLASGVFDDSDVPQLLQAPTEANAIGDGRVGPEHTVTLDLRHALVSSQATLAGQRVTIEQFASSVHPGIHVVEVTAPAELEEAAASLVAEHGSARTESSKGAIATTSRRSIEADGPDNSVTVRRVTAMAASPPETLDVGQIAAHRLGSASALRTKQRRDEHTAYWGDLWARTAIDLPDRADIETRIRFAQYHLLTSAGTGRESAIGARGASGQAYRGHVFWDTDVFVVPALAAMDAPRARAALGYRHRRLGSAKQHAIRQGRAGARFPWESAASGGEVAPTEGTDLHGRTIPIKTGEQEIHIVADIAWTAMHYLVWTGDTSFARGAATDLLVETARYWQSRVERDPDGAGHIRNVIGPDEYHEDVDDNVFTNAMARWNLRTAAEWCATRGVVDESERHAWQATADALVDGYDPRLGYHEQFTGYFDLDPTLVSGLGAAPLAADALLGRERIAQVQIIKQPDVLMLHHLLPDEPVNGSFEADLEFYLPRTAHGSSLSPAITASLLARANRLDEASHWFDVALAIDLDDLSQTTAGGLHLATMGGVWQAVAFGFLGMRAHRQVLHVDPRVPPDWGTLTMRCTYRGVALVVAASSERTQLTAASPVVITIGGDPATHTTDRLVAIRHDDDWTIQ